MRTNGLNARRHAGYQELRTRIRDYYRRNFPLTGPPKQNALLNRAMAGFQSCVTSRAWRWRCSTRCSRRSWRVRVDFASHRAGFRRDDPRQGRDRARAQPGVGQRVNLSAPLFVDATETGDLLPLTKTSPARESQNETGELHAKPEAQPQNMQAFTCCFAMEYLHGEDHTIEKPREWEFWRDYVPSLTPPWTGRLLDLVAADPRTWKPRQMGFDPQAGSGWFHYRRIVDRKNFVAGTYAGDVSLVNWPQNDYLPGNPL